MQTLLQINPNPFSLSTRPTSFFSFNIDISSQQNEVNKPVDQVTTAIPDN